MYKSSEELLPVARATQETATEALRMDEYAAQVNDRSVSVAAMTTECVSRSQLVLTNVKAESEAQYLAAVARSLLRAHAATIGSRSSSRGNSSRTLLRSRLCDSGTQRRSAIYSRSTLFNTEPITAAVGRRLCVCSTTRAPSRMSAHAAEP